ncbi:MAG: hypothetical protein RIF41_22315 [Polyangiaceae bacterium]
MSSSAPIALRLGFTLVDDGFHFLRHVAEQLDVSSRKAREASSAFEMSAPEKDFAKRLLRDKRNLWLYRCHQRCFCGDFAVVDMSGATPADRRVLVAELKEREPLVVGVGPGSQLARAHDVVAQLVEEKVIDTRAQVLLAIGDSEELLAWLDDWS